MMAGAIDPVELKNALQDPTHHKIVEMGWTGMDDTSLAEYVVLMLANGKNPEELGTELATDLLGLAPDDASVQEFVPWLFQQLQALQGQSSGTAEIQQQEDQGSAQNGGDAGDMEMAESADGAQGQGQIPTGPKAMRNSTSSSSGNGMNRQRDRRILGQVQKNMDRPADAALHRVRGAQGVGRINSHAGRDPPKGPRAAGIARGLAAQPMQQPNGQQFNMPGMMPMGMPPMGMGMPGVPMDPMQLQQMFSMLAESANTMQKFAESMQNGGPVINPNFQRNQGNRPQGKFNNRQNGHFNKQRPQPGQDTAMGDASAEGGADSTSPLDKPLSGSGPQDPANTRCRFDLNCTNPNCPFAHQSPAAPPKTNIDMSDVCAHGAACKNKKCNGRHPSPAKKHEFQKEQDCVFWPQCNKGDACPFRHPEGAAMPPCRNGADCQVAGCEFSHSKVACKFNPCTNQYCQFKHVEGQKKKIMNKTWTPNGGSHGHVSERKFTTEDDGEEEFIAPGSGNDDHDMETQVRTGDGIEVGDIA